MLSDTLPCEPLDAPQSSTKLSTGVYFLFLRGALTYVGRSSNCPARIESHRQNGRVFDRHIIAPCNPEDAEWMERALLAAMEPAQNRALYSAPARAAVAGDEHPLMLVNTSAARRRIRGFHLQREFDAAVRSGELVFHLKNPNATSPTAQRVILLGELIAWCEAKQRAKGFATG